MRAASAWSAARSAGRPKRLRDPSRVRPRDLRQVAAGAGDDVDVHVRHVLPRRGAVVHQHGAALTRQPRRALRNADARRGLEEGGALGGRELVQKDGVAARDHQRVARADGVDVQERHAVRVRVHQAGRRLAADDGAERAAGRAAQAASRSRTMMMPRDSLAMNVMETCTSRSPPAKRKT
jgi:hypothetical protein